MEMIFGVIADAVNESKEGKLNIAGEFNGIWAAEVPLLYPGMVVFARFHARIAEGADHHGRVSLVDDDGAEVLQKSPPIPMKFIPGGPGKPLRAQVILQIASLRLPKFGDYEYHFLIDDQFVGSVPFSVFPLSQR